MLSVLSVIAAMRHFSVVGGKRQAVENGTCDARSHKIPPWPAPFTSRKKKLTGAPAPATLSGMM